MRLLLAALSLLVAAAPVSAQREADTGTRFTRPKPAEIPDNPSLTPAERGRVALAQFAGCLFEKGPAKSVAVLNSKDTVRFSQLEMNECLRSGSLRFDDSLLRGALFAELYRRDYADHEPKLSDGPFDFASTLADDNQARVGLLMFADCVARQDLKNARLFMLSRGGSTDEKNSFAALRPIIGPCVPQGQTVTLTKTAIGSALAEAIYQQSLPKPVEVKP